jgi:hypothetical protein
MQLNETVRQRLAQEYKFAADRIREVPDLPSKMYFFSVFHGEANRALNIAWNSNIALLHMVLQSAYETINGRLKSPVVLESNLLGIPKGFVEALTELSTELADLFQSRAIDQEKLHQLLVRLAELTYVTTGNGYYLYLRGAIKI